MVLSAAMKQQKITIYKHDTILNAHYMPRNVDRCVLIITSSIPEEINKQSYINLLKCIIHTFNSHDFTVLRLPTKYGMDKSIHQQTLNDVLETTDWMTEKHSDATLMWVCGVGYGGYLSLNVSMRRPRINGFVSISPFVGKEFQINSLTPCPGGLILHGEHDKLTNALLVSQLASELITQKGSSVDFNMLNNTGHLYENRLEEVSLYLRRYIGSRVNSPVVKKAVIA